MIGTPWDDSQAGTGAVTSVNGLDGDVTLSAADVGADRTGSAEESVTAHVAETDPHTVYQLRDEAGAANGYAQLNGSGLVVQAPASASATPTPSAIVVADESGKLDGWITAASTSAPGLVQFAADAEIAGNKAVLANDTRLSDARTPTPHATDHQHGGSDEIATATASPNGIPKANSGGKLESGWGGAANSLATLDGSALVPTAQQGTGSASSTTFLRGDRSWATALQGGLGSTDNALLRADGTGGLTAQGSGATLDDLANLTLGNRSFNQPITPSSWAGTGTNHDLPFPAWATANGRYLALVRVRVQQNSTTSSFMARTAQLELTCSGGAWSIDATSMYSSVGPLATSLGWLISGSNLRMNLSGVGGGNAGNVALVFEQFIFYGAL